MVNEKLGVLCLCLSKEDDHTTEMGADDEDNFGGLTLQLGGYASFKFAGGLSFVLCFKQYFV